MFRQHDAITRGKEESKGTRVSGSIGVAAEPHFGSAENRRKRSGRRLSFGKDVVAATVRVVHVYSQGYSRFPGFPVLPVRYLSLQVRLTILSDLAGAVPVKTGKPVKGGV